MTWTRETYQARIENVDARRRHAAGSPSDEEIGMFHAACEGADLSGTALVLGMTPELRVLAAKHFRRVLSVDASQTAIDLFAAWLPAELRAKETIIHGQWSDLDRWLQGPVSIVLGDGILGNLTNFETAAQILKVLNKVMSPGARCVMRNVIVMERLEIDRFRFLSLQNDFRSGLIDAAEFGFSARMLGFFDVAYDHSTEVLDSARAYTELDAMQRAGTLSAAEVSAINRYRFMGSNYFPLEASWTQLLLATGFGQATTMPLRGKLWHAFYPVQWFTGEGR